MKKILSIFLIFILCFNLTGITSSAATAKLNYKSAVVVEGDYLYLSVEGTKKKATWTSSDEYMASVSKKGKVTTNGEGRVNIIAKVGNKKLVCKVLIIPNIDPNYKTDTDIAQELAEREYIDNFGKDVTIIIDEKDDNSNEKTTTDSNTNARIEEMLKYGFGSSEDIETEIGKAYIEFCRSWVSEYELKNSYNISTAQSISNDIYLIMDVDNRYIIKNVSNKLTSGEIYTDNGLQYQYLDKFNYNGNSYTEKQFYFNRNDLINKGIIK